MRSIGIFKKTNRRVLLTLAVSAILAAVVLVARPSYANLDAEPRGAVNGIEAFGARSMRIVSTSGVAGGQVAVTIELDSEGNEVAASFTLNFDPTVLNSPVVALGTGAPANTVLNTNPNLAASGRLGILIYSGNAFAASPPARQVVTVTFNIAATAPAGPSAITFVTSPTPLSVSSLQGVLLTTVYEVGVVTVSVPPPTSVTIGGKVTTPTGQNLRNAVVSLIDANNVKRTSTTGTFGLYSFDNVLTGATYTMTVSSKRYRFSPRVVVVTEGNTNLNFVGLE